MRKRIAFGEILEFEFEGFTWNAAKAARNVSEHKVDFNYAVRLFDGPVLAVAEDEEGEVRWLAIGSIEGREYAVAFSERATVCNIISGRRATRGEREAYYKGLAKRSS